MQVEEKVAKIPSPTSQPLRMMRSRLNLDPQVFPAFSWVDSGVAKAGDYWMIREPARPASKRQKDAKLV